MIRAAILAVVALGAGMGAEAQTAIPGWKVSTSTDKMDGTKNVIYSRTADESITDSLGRASKPGLYLRCSKPRALPGTLKLYIGFANNLFSSHGGNDVRVRFDEGEVQQTRWAESDSGEAMFWNTIEMNDFAGAKEMHVELSPPLNTRQYTKFVIAGSEKVVDTLIEACSLKGEDLAEFDRRAGARLRERWLDGLGKNDYLGAYRKLHNALLREAAIQGAEIGVFDDRSRPIPVADLVDALMNYMQKAKLCIINTEHSSYEAGEFYLPCPSAMTRYTYLTDFVELKKKEYSVSDLWNVRANVLGPEAAGAGVDEPTASGN